MTAPERIWAAPPTDDLEWVSGAGEWDVSENWAVDQIAEYVRADLHDATKAQLDKAWEICFAATNRGMIAERKLAKAVEALREITESSATYQERAKVRAVLAEIEKGVT